MQLGFSTMNTMADPDPRDLARMVEQAGFESLWMGEHSHIPRCRTTAYPGGGELPEPYKKMRDPYIALMAAATATTTLKLGTGISLLMEREIISQAKTISTLDQLCGGRLLLGVGVGWNKEEFENSNTAIPWNKRYRGLEEVVSATRRMFSDEAPEFHGEFIDFDPIWFEPKPIQAGGPPVLMGAMGPKGIEHAARWADGWMPADIALLNIEEDIARFKAQVASFGRDPEQVDITVVAMSEINRDLLLRYRDAGVGRTIIGVGVDNWDRPEVIEPLIELGASMIDELK
ncbi:TIGR03619 family F420-dependent LLM class oxidoreductase [Spongiibacter sp. KMU-158]|uniref:TIGR03619 family F420-dependent LLM class oxidoreductase n=1 Tax=Spongiibacter pelagi TaxID=2760804 RepID=A0A927C0V3_9GAMM|nr:TIGR03619 family F420-dependent LLM class oxidoreductase [Spongiibacter pelagi]MBD2857736.1 TIGR03619 family F420-dependent LLM class oxidoreductase [Spongiibacter pelagi]